MDPEFKVHDWDDIKVPANWEVEGFGVPIYVNHQYEFADFKAPVSRDIKFVDRIYPGEPGKVPHHIILQRDLCMCVRRTRTLGLHRICVVPGLGRYSRHI
jgi:hypothetical protein